MEPTGAGTGWFTAIAPVDPLETVTIAWALFDMGDAFFDTTVLIDNWRWSCVGCDPETMGCGITPQ